MKELRELRLAVDQLHNCKASHLRSEPVLDTLQGKTVWKGVVEVFELSGHPQAKLCYAWKHWEDDEGECVRIVTVLGIAPVDSPLTAVRVAIIGDSKRNQAN